MDTSELVENWRERRLLDLGIAGSGVSLSYRISGEPWAG